MILGPSLVKLGIYGNLQHPTLVLSQSASGGGAPTVVATAYAWGSLPKVGASPLAPSVQPANAALMARASASALPTGSADAAMVATLPPGVYTLQAPPADFAVGEVMMEVTHLP